MTHQTGKWLKILIKKGVIYNYYWIYQINTHVIFCYFKVLDYFKYTEIILYKFITVYIVTVLENFKMVVAAFR